MPGLREPGSETGKVVELHTVVVDAADYVVHQRFDDVEKARLARVVVACRPIHVKTRRHALAEHQQRPLGRGPASQKAGGQDHDDKRGPIKAHESRYPGPGCQAAPPGT